MTLKKNFLKQRFRLLAILYITNEQLLSNRKLGTSSLEQKSSVYKLKSLAKSLLDHLGIHRPSQKPVQDGDHGYIESDLYRQLGEKKECASRQQNQVNWPGNHEHEKAGE